MSTAFDPAREHQADDDLRLVERFLAGDTEAFDVLYARYYDRVFHIAQGVLLRHDEAADVTQEIFTLVYRNLHRFDRRSRFTTWLYRVAVNRSIQQARSLRHVRMQVPLDEAIDHVEPPSEEPADPAVAQAMQKLSLDDRAILTLFYWEDLSLAEIADSLGCSPNAAKTRLFRARERFRQFFEEASR